MSAYREQETAMNDVNCLRDSLKEMKLRSGKSCEPEVHDQPVPLVGYEGSNRKQTAEVVIKRAQVGGSSNDIGFARGADGNFKAIISDYDRSFYSEKWLDGLKQNYAERKAKQVARDSGLGFVDRQVTANGTIRLQFNRL